MTFPIPDYFKDLEEITAGDIREMIEKGEVLVERKTIRGEALKVLHEAFFQEIPVEVEGALIDGNLDFTKGPFQAVDRAKDISPRLRREPEKRGLEEVVLVRGTLGIEDSVIIGRVWAGFTDRAKSVVFPKVWFNSTIFGEGVTFEGATFGDGTDFMGSTFGDWAKFGYASFGDKPRFLLSSFGEKATFLGATFGEGAGFFGTTFGNGADFVMATFGKSTTLGGTKFAEEAMFIGATFGEGANFWGTTFGNGASFSGTTFEGAVVFQGLRKPIGSREEREDIGVEVERVVIEIGSSAGEKILIFAGEVDFREVTFEVPDKVIFQHVNLSQARFLETIVDKVQFVDVDELWPRHPTENRKCVYDEIAHDDENGNKKNYSLIARLYRQLKKNYEEQRAYPEAGDFHYGEMEMTLRMHQEKKERFSWMLTGAYKFLSGYGEKPGLAFVWVGVVLLTPALVYFVEKLVLAPGSGIVSSIVESLTESLGYMTVRIAKQPASVWGKFFKFAQAILGPIQIALVALALRRKFRR